MKSAGTTVPRFRSAVSRTASCTMRSWVRSCAAVPGTSRRGGRAPESPTNGEERVVFHDDPAILGPGRYGRAGELTIDFPGMRARQSWIGFTLFAFFARTTRRVTVSTSTSDSSTGMVNRPRSAGATHAYPPGRFDRRQ